MTGVNKTLYIPLYGKAYVSRKGIILSDKKAEELWSAEGKNIPLKGKSRSKWLAYYMGMRSAVYDCWLKEQLAALTGAAVFHIGCGLDSRVERVGTNGHQWYDIDFPEVIEERRRWYSETDEYHMIGSDATDIRWLEQIPKYENAFIVMEGVCMYMKLNELSDLFAAMNRHFGSVSILMDCYTTAGAKATEYKNPINEVGVTKVYGMDDPGQLTDNTGIEFVSEHEMTPQPMIAQLRGMEKAVFKKLFAGGIAKKMYRMYEYKSR